MTFHLTLGQRIRVVAERRMVASTGTSHPDEASMFTIVKLWEYLQGIDIPIFKNAPEPSESYLKSQQKALVRYREAMRGMFNKKRRPFGNGVGVLNIDKWAEICYT